MCGIAARFLGRDGSRSYIHDLGRSLQALRHRGPESVAVWHHPRGRCSLGHTRLALVGLDNGAQPISDAQAELHLVVNGEFYGHDALRVELAARGHRFETDSDSEVALKLYREWGAAGLHRLRGEFALLLYDAQQNMLIGMRDRVGVKPLFYAEHDGAILFASEAKALFAMGVPAVWDEESYCSRAFYLGDRSLFAGIRAVRPGQMIFATRAGLTQQTYWDFDFSIAPGATPAREDEAIGGMRAAIEEAVALRMRADVPIAIYLSGGIDSSAMLGVASRLAGKPMEAFNISFPEDEALNEQRFAQIAADHCGAMLHDVAVRSNDLADHFEDAVWHNETPFFNSHGIAKYLLSRAVRDAGYKAVITGEGADEVFGGYPHFRRDAILFNPEGQDPGFIAAAREKLADTEAAYRQQTPPADVAWLAERLGHGVSWIDNQAGWFTQLTELMTDQAAILAKVMAPYRMLYNMADHRRLAGVEPVHRSMYLWAKTFLPAFVLTTLGDRMEMAHSIEGRVPLLDHHVIEAACRLPVNMKIRGSVEKYVFREAMRPYLPEAIYTRKKHYFRAPPSTAKREARLHELVRDVINGPDLAALPFFDPKKVREFVDKLDTMPAPQRAAFDPALMEITSLCLLQRRYAVSATDATNIRLAG